MYYRTFIHPDGRECGIPQGIALATSSNGGATWTPENGGRPLSALRSVNPNGDICAPSDDYHSYTTVFAPDVIADGTRLVMAFEQKDNRPNWFGPTNERALHSVRYVTSTDGRNWSGSKQILAPGAVGAWDDEVGTPDIEKDGAGYVLTFHGHDSSGRLTQGRATVRMSTLTENYSGARNRFILNTTPSWANYGIGVGDMTREADGYWYMVFEAFGGATGVCGRDDTRTAVGIARSTDARSWTLRNAPLITGRVLKSCGWDMPAWHKIGGVTSIVTPNDPPEDSSLVRWNVVNKVGAASVTSGNRLQQNQYLPAGASLTSNDGRLRLTMQGDGNLVLYRNDGFVMWASDTDRSGAVRAYMQYDGNLVLQRADGSAVRATATDSRPGASLYVHGDRIVIEAYGMTVWERLSGSRGM